MPEENNESTPSEEVSEPLGTDDGQESEGFAIPSTTEVADKIDAPDDISDSDIEDIISNVLNSEDNPDSLEDDVSDIGAEYDDIIDEVIKEEDFESDELDDEDIDKLIDEVISETSDSEDLEESIGDSEDDETDEPVTGVQKRIDQLLARAKSAEEKNNELIEKITQIEARISEKEETPKAETKEDKISKAELSKVLNKFMEEGDNQGVMDVFQYMLDEQSNSLKEQYAQEQTQAQQKAAQRQEEWQSIVEEFNPETYEDEILKEDTDFDIRDSSSKIYKLSEKLYIDGVNKEYSGKGGMKRAVKDAYTVLLKELLNGKKKIRSKETEGLKQRLVKEQRKKSVPAGSSSGEDRVRTSPKNSKEELDEVISERKKYKSERIGM